MVNKSQIYYKIKDQKTTNKKTSYNKWSSKYKYFPLIFFFGDIIQSSIEMIDLNFFLYKWKLPLNPTR